MIRYLLFFLLFLISCEEKSTITSNTIKGDKFYKEGEKLLLKDNIKAYSKFQEAINYYTIQKDSSNISKSLICQAIAQKYTGDVLGSETTLVEALKLMKNNDESIYSVYGTLGDLKYEQKEYSDATQWYNSALNEKIESNEAKFSILNNRSAAEFRQKKYISALKTLQGIDLSRITDISLINRIKENIVYIKWLENNTYPAQKEINEILHSKLRNNDLWGANSSYAHLAEINQENDPSTSLVYAKEMLNIATRNNSPEDRLEAFERIMLVDNSSNLRATFKKYKSLSDSIQISRNNSRNRFALIKYDSEKKNAENQKLKAETAENNLKIIIRNIGLGALSLLLIGGFFWYRKRKKRLEQEKELEVKNTQLKMSKKVHDVVANGIYQVMTKIENQEDFSKDEALDELEFVYEKSRDISYEKEDARDELDFSEKISTSIGSFNNDSVKTYIAGNEKPIWEHVSQAKQEEIYQIIRELLVNMKKHSQASIVSFRFEKNNNEITIHYKDNGIGMSGAVMHKNGLTNMVSRIEILKGQIIFDPETEKGLKIDISFPVY